MVLHTLRHFIGDDAFFAFLRRTGGAQADRPIHVTTDDVVRIAEEEAGRDLGWFFDAYLYHAELPRLVTERSEGEFALQWESPSDTPFVLPIPVRIDGETRVVPMGGGAAVLSLPPEASVSIDPANHVLHQSPDD
jgi:aminopeptidase N